uniref:BHLH domain-containing protein n=1 Tax=Sinocyclocheilus rhinocerous TaxID=307959 RepID=A0A673G2L1_9TELE
MTPTIISKELLPLNNKLRKPMVEKMCRDRINSSIEQLKCLLAPEFLKQQPDSKLEEADILEMKLNFLLRHNCVSVRLCTSYEDTEPEKTKHFQKLQQNRRESVLPDQKTFSKDMNVNKSAIWRPW